MWAISMLVWAERAPELDLQPRERGFGIAFRFGCCRFDSVPVLEWIVITGSLDWAKG